MRIRLARRSRNSLGVLAVLAALGAVIVLRSPTSADAPTTSTPTPTPSASTGARVDLDGPAIDGVLAFGEGALLATGSRDVYAELRLRGLAPESSGPRPPVALAVVVDHSGSMLGEKMQQADEAVVSLVSRMRDDDWLSVTVYDDTAEILQPLARVGTIRETLAALVRSVQADGGTNIPLGLDLGATTLSSAPAGSIRRVVLLSDGIDGSGESLASIEARIGARATDRTTTSALGIGIDYDERVMSGIAEAGRGNYAFLEREEMLAPFLARELDQASSTVADSVVADVQLPPGLDLVEAHGATVERAGSALRIPIGAIWAGERRKVVLHLASAPGAVGTTLAAPVRLSYRTTDDTAHAIAGVATLARVASDAELAASRDAEIWSDAYATVLDARQDLALAAWREGRREEARQMTEANVAMLQQAQAAHPAPIFAQRIAERQQEMQDYQVEASSAAGRSAGLGHHAARIESASAF